MWAVSPIGRGTALTPVWNGVPALCRGVPMSVAISTAALFRSSQAASTVSSGSKTVGNGRTAALNRPLVRSFSSIGTIKAVPARRMGNPIMSVSWRNAKTALSTPSRAIPAIAADRTNTPWDIMKSLGMVFRRIKEGQRKNRGFLSSVCSFAFALLILSAISESTAGVLNENIANGIGMIVLIILVAIAAVMFISSGSKTAPFAYLEKEKFETEYGVSGMVKERKAQYKDLHTKHNIVGTCLCVTALIPLFIGAIINADSDLFLIIMLSLSFLIAGVGVICFIKTGIIWASYEKLLQEGEYSKENKEKPSLSSAIYTAYWVIAAAVYLGYSLSSNNWGQSWIIWVVAGVIFPAVIAITNAFEKKSK